MTNKTAIKWIGGTAGAVLIGLIVTAIWQAPTVIDAKAEIIAIKEFSAENASLVTVLLGNTNVVSLDMGTVVAGDRILFNWKMQMIKGVIDGNTVILLVKDTGTAVVEFYHNFPNVRDDHYQLANITWTFVGSVVAKIKTSGTLNMIIRMSSDGSNGMINLGDAYYEAWRSGLNPDLVDSECVKESVNQGFDRFDATDIEVSRLWQRRKTITNS